MTKLSILMTTHLLLRRYVFYCKDWLEFIKTPATYLICFVWSSIIRGVSRMILKVRFQSYSGYNYLYIKSLYQMAYYLYVGSTIIFIKVRFYQWIVKISQMLYLVFSTIRSWQWTSKLKYTICYTEKYFRNLRSSFFS